MVVDQATNGVLYPGCLFVHCTHMSSCCVVVDEATNSEQMDSWEVKRRKCVTEYTLPVLLTRDTT